MNTQAYVSCYLDRKNTEIEMGMSCFRQLSLWCHRNTRIINIAQAVFGALGIAAVALLPLTLPVLGTGAVILAAVGEVLSAVSYLAYQILNLALPLSHNMSHHIFQPASCQGGRIYYQGDIPIVELDADDPATAGKAHGYLLGPYIEKVIKRLDFAFLMANLNPFGKSRPYAHQVPRTLEAIRAQLPCEYVAELEGLVDGYNQWAQERKWLPARKVTFDEFLMFHLMPDHLHFSVLEHENFLKSGARKTSQVGIATQDVFPAMGCIAIIDKDPEEGITFARNMDWPHLNIFGESTVIFNRKHKNLKQSTVEIGIPGFIGTLTGMNSQGLCLGMNVCRGDTKQIEGLPLAFYNRYCLENCSNVAEVGAELKKGGPLGKYHLIVADAERVTVFHIHQDPDQDLLHHEKGLDSDMPLVVANYEYGPDGTRKHDINSSEVRHQLVEEFYRDGQQQRDKCGRGEFAAKALSLHKINHGLTTHTVVMKPKLMRMFAAFNNGFSASSPLHEVDIHSLFQRSP